MMPQIGEKGEKYLEYFYTPWTETSFGLWVEFDQKQISLNPQLVSTTQYISKSYPFAIEPKRGDEMFSTHNEIKRKAKKLLKFSIPYSNLDHSMISAHLFYF